MGLYALWFFAGRNDRQQHLQGSSFHFLLLGCSQGFRKDGNHEYPAQACEDTGSD